MPQPLDHAKRHLVHRTRLDFGAHLLGFSYRLPLRDLPLHRMHPPSMPPPTQRRRTDRQAACVRRVPETLRLRLRTHHGLGAQQAEVPHRTLRAPSVNKSKEADS